LRQALEERLHDGQPKTLHWDGTGNRQPLNAEGECERARRSSSHSLQAQIGWSCRHRWLEENLPQLLQMRHRQNRENGNVSLTYRIDAISFRSREVIMAHRHSRSKCHQGLCQCPRPSRLLANKDRETTPPLLCPQNPKICTI